MAAAGRAIVVGGGIGGLAAAAGLRRAGIEVVVLEQADAVREIGGGLSLWTNAINALGKLGLREEVLAIGAPIERQELRSFTGELLLQWPMGEMSRRHGAPSVAVH